MKSLLNILWFSWRDIKNPERGGAEVFSYEVMRRLVRKGYNITLLTSRFPNSQYQEKIDGIDIVRKGGKFTVYSKAKDYYNQNNKAFDIIVDEMNTKPFLTPKFVKDKPILGLIHQVPREGLFYELPFPISYITYHYLVKRWLGNYRNIPTITVSDSQKKILQTFGFKKIFVVPEGLSVIPLDRVYNKDLIPAIAFIGRLKGYKLPNHAVEAFSLIKKEFSDAKMLIIGDGYMRRKLEKMNIPDVVFYGRVDEKTKRELLSKVHLVLVPSVEEGWGLVVIESNAMGTPVVAYDVSGLRDSVRDGITGVLVQNNSPGGLAKAAIELLNDREKLAKLSYEALQYSRGFDWDNTTREFDRIIKTMAQYDSCYDANNGSTR